jgi:uncharacterized phage protein (TIGR01671 family)
MERVIKFEYIVKMNTMEGIKYEKYAYTLEEIEKKIFTHKEDILVAKRQFTGLTDKNGKDIYEGDIVLMHQFLFDGHECENELKGVIEYSGLGLMISKIECMPYSKYTGQNDGEGKDYIVNFYGLHEESFEVIGNIHENPELLNQTS